MKHKEIYITTTDFVRLTQLLSEERLNPKSREDGLNKLASELGRAVKVASDKIAPDVVTMNTVIEFADLDNGITKEIKLVYPKHSDIRMGYVSVTAPIGTALLGYRKGDIIEWKVPAGKRRFLIREVIYQPEANGDYLI